MPAASTRTYKVGDRVRFLFGASRITGRVIGDYGGIGIGGRQLVRIEFRLDEYNVKESDIPAAELTLARRTKAR
jgi:hypothetical protein